MSNGNDTVFIRVNYRHAMLPSSLYSHLWFNMSKSSNGTWKLRKMIIHLTLLPPANEVWSKVMFLHLCLSTGGRGSLYDVTSRASSVLLFPTFWGLSYFFLLLGKIPTFSYFFRFLLKLIDKNAIFKPQKFFCLASLGIISFSKQLPIRIL